MTTVAIYGGGIGGLSAALELAERGFSVTVYEPRAVLGGKARSEPADPSPFPGVPDTVAQPPAGSLLPGEHGFRFFPAFYRHLPDSMTRIPVSASSSAPPSNAFEQLVECPSAMLAQSGRPPVVVPTGSAHGWRERLHQLNALRPSVWGLSIGDYAHAARIFLGVLCSCQQRRDTVLENETWWTFTGAGTRSAAFQNVIGGMIRTFVAARPTEMSARTAAAITIQLMFTGKSEEICDRVLNGPTSEVLIDPWVARLRQLGVQFVTGVSLRSLSADGGRIVAASLVDAAGSARDVTADHHVLAMPADRLAAVVAASGGLGCPSLAGVASLTERWMTGIQFFTAADVPIVAGHTVYLNAQWALTSISQAQFWPHVSLAERSGGAVRGEISTDICNFDEPGTNGAPASACSADEIAAEVWRQMQAEVPALAGVTPVAYLLDDDISWVRTAPDPSASGSAPGVSQQVNSEPMLINTAGSLAKRPNAATELRNLFVACDAVVTTTDIATMEGANEAARRAVNALLDEVGSSAPRCELFAMQEPAIFRPFRWLDGVWWRLRHRRASSVR